MTVSCQCRILLVDNLYICAFREHKLALARALASSGLEARQEGFFLDCRNLAALRLCRHLWPHKSCYHADCTPAVHMLENEILVS